MAFSFQGTPAYLMYVDPLRCARNVYVWTDVSFVTFLHFIIVVNVPVSLFWADYTGRRLSWEAGIKMFASGQISCHIFFVGTWNWGILTEMLSRHTSANVWNENVTIGNVQVFSLCDKVLDRSTRIEPIVCQLNMLRSNCMPGENFYRGLKSFWKNEFSQKLLWFVLKSY